MPQIWFKNPQFCQNLVVHHVSSQLQCCNVEWKVLHHGFGSLQTEVHYSVLSLLLILSGSPSNTDFTERPRVKEAGEQKKHTLGHTYTNMQTCKFCLI